MTISSTHAAVAERAIVATALGLALITLGLQAGVLRPHLWPAGPGLAVAGETVMGALAAPRPVSMIRPPDIRAALREELTVVGVAAGGAADRAGIRVGDRAIGIYTGGVTLMGSGVWRARCRWRAATCGSPRWCGGPLPTTKKNGPHRRSLSRTTSGPPVTATETF